MGKKIRSVATAAIISAATIYMNTAQAADQIRIVIDQQPSVVVDMLDNPASQDFISMLPMQVTFEDFARTEKITYLPRRLNTDNSPTPAQASGDFTYYAPWGNIAVFYKGLGHDSRLFVLGKIASGKEVLAQMNGDFSARIEKVE
ncbi:cyclophilin-like fold protein [Vibrio mangrovi]|uniref:Cyclophilin-like fold protein n=1 Tax=Vibrio mangrovi TaxID=474394 RepID=A0A1Y6ITZ0_9VIBR|nr:cyclophilin-like fold protein [Vibrio mangrovi]MDW6003260.1 cyclophilin-like fold protein [Vibrio mangrovi]SMR99952.1 hypothetical protein VIM7927_01190 [Vibrio mangrovi]